MAGSIGQDSRLLPWPTPLKRVTSLKGLAVGIPALLVIWAGPRLVPEEVGFEIGMGYQVFLTAMVGLSAVVLWLPVRDRLPFRRTPMGVLGGLIAVFLSTMGLLIVIGEGSPQSEEPLQGQTVPEVTWTEEAVARLQQAPSFLRGMVRRATEAYALRKGYSQITPEVMTEARERMGM